LEIVGTTCRSTYNDVSGDAYIMPSAHRHIGQVCAARYSGNDEWHRCYIVDVKLTEAEVMDEKYLVYILFRQ